MARGKGELEAQVSLLKGRPGSQSSAQRGAMHPHILSAQRGMPVQNLPVRCGTLASSASVACSPGVFVSNFSFPGMKRAMVHRPRFRWIFTARGICSRNRVRAPVGKQEPVARLRVIKGIPVINPPAQGEVEQVRLERRDEHGEQFRGKYLQGSRIIARALSEVVEHGPLVIHLDRQGMQRRCGIPGFTER